MRKRVYNRVSVDGHPLWLQSDRMGQERSSGNEPTRCAIGEGQLLDTRSQYRGVSLGNAFARMPQLRAGWLSHELAGSRARLCAAAFLHIALALRRIEHSAKNLV